MCVCVCVCVCVELFLFLYIDSLFFNQRNSMSINISELARNAYRNKKNGNNDPSLWVLVTDAANILGADLESKVKVNTIDLISCCVITHFYNVIVRCCSYGVGDCGKPMGRRDGAVEARGKRRCRLCK